MKTLTFFIIYFLSTTITFSQLGYKTSWIANSGGMPQDHIMNSVDNMFVRSDGTVYAITDWDEGGANVSVFKNGAVVAIPVDSGTGSWGRMSNLAVWADNNYIYQSMSQHGCDGGNSNLNSNNLPQFPPCVGGNQSKWQCIRRYKQDGSSAPFTKGYGYDGSMLIVNENGEAPSGITVIGNELFVSDPTSDDTVKVYDNTNLSTIPIRQFQLPRVGLLFADSQNFIWMLQNASATAPAKIIRFNSSNGALQSQQITFPSGVIPSAFCIDNKNRILVTDIGVNQNIRIYSDIFTIPALTATFGTQLGIYSGISGKVGSLKFNKPMGVGTDLAGNIYVGNTSFEKGGTSVESYNVLGQLNWKLEGLVFTSTADFDKNTEGDVYIADKHFSLDLSKTNPGSEWEYKGYTFNKFKYPHDARNFGWFTSALIRRINNQKFLFISDMYGHAFGVYRFNQNTDGEIAIPNVYFTSGIWDPSEEWGTTFPLNKEWLWQDKNADATIQQNEYDAANVDNNYCMAWWADENGGVWKGLREQGLRYFPSQGIDANGAIQYSYASSIKYDLPNGINGVKRILYKADTDDLYLGGFSVARPDTGDTWWSIGTVICKYSNWSTGNRTPSLTINLPFDPSNNRTILNAKAFTVEGDYVFVALAKDGIINVYNKTAGTLVGVIQPGPEVDSESGWTDINIAITASKRMNGEYVIFAEENGYGKVIMYRWCPANDCIPAPSAEKLNKGIFNLFPNPAQDKVFIINLPLDTEIKLLDIQGRELISKKTTTEKTELNLQALPQGVYIIKTQNNAQKLIIE